MPREPRTVGDVLSDAVLPSLSENRPPSRKVKEVRVVVWREPEGSAECPTFRGYDVNLQAMRLLWQRATGQEREVFLTELRRWLR